MAYGDETRDLWDRIADDWQIQVGNTGDRNRILNSDPVLREFARDVRGLAVLDAGCGTGYLSKQLHDSGARVTAIDLSPRMIEIARAHYPAIDFRVDSCAELRTVGDNSIDLIVSNYVLMDTPDLDRSVRSFYRVLRPGAAAVLIFSHPCFPQGGGRAAVDGATVSYTWESSYFQPRKCIDPPWGHFTSEFIWFHRPLSDYWKAFIAAGFSVEGFEEPRIDEARQHLAANAREVMTYETRPCSVAFKLRKP